MAQKDINKHKKNDGNDLKKDKEKPEFNMEERAYGPQKEEKEYSQHVYDINLTELYFSLQTLFSNNQLFLEGFKDFLNAVLKHIDFTFKDITDKKIPLIVRPLGYHYRASLAYQLMIMDEYKIPLFLNYHYATYPQPNQTDFVHILEYGVYEDIVNKSPKEINSLEIRKILSKWIEIKQNNSVDYFQNVIREKEKESVLEIFLFYYAETRVKKGNYIFLEIDDDAVNKLIYKFINFNSGEFKKEYNREEVKYKWNGTLVALAYFIYFLTSIKKNGYYLFDQINIPNFIDITFGNKENKRITEETITRNINLIENGNLSKPVQEQDEILCEIWDQIQFPKSNR